MPLSAHPTLVAHARTLTPDFIELSKGVWSAVGHALCNVHILEGDEGLVVIDTTEGTGAAEKVMTHLRACTQKPVRAIIYTHGHSGHVSGSTIFTEGASDVEIIASDRFRSPHSARSSNVNVPMPKAAMARRARRETGADLSRSQRLTLGGAANLRPTAGVGAGHLEPTLYVPAEGLKLTTAGVSLQLYHTPGESDDHIAVWHPDSQTLFCGDTFSAAFPNLYPLRGRPYCDFEAWARSLDDLLSFGAETLAPSHTRPVTGREEVAEVLTDYRDAIRFIITATAEGLNAGRSVDELAATIKLPQTLANKSHLAEVYGTVAWAVRAYACGTLGWFDGNPTNMAPLPPREEAENLIALAGGPEALLAAAEEADNPQWAMQLCDRLIAAGECLPEARGLKHACLRVLASGELNASARNYYLSCAQEMDV